MADLKKKFMDMKVADLRRELDTLGLEKTGIKTVLVDRLVKHYESLENEKDEQGEGVKEPAENGSGDGSISMSEDVVVEDEIAEEMHSEVETEVPQKNADNNTEKEEVPETAEEGESNQFEEEIENDVDSVDAGQEDHAELDIKDQPESDANKNENEQEVNDEETTGEGEAETGDGNEDENEPVGLLEGNSDANDKGQEETEEEQPTSPTPKEDDEHTNETTSTPAEDGNSGNMSTTSNNEAETSNKTHEEEVEPRSKEKDRESERERLTILVTGLSSDTTANDLKTFFRLYGKIGRIKIMTNTRVPGSQRFAHVCATSQDDLAYFVTKLSGMTLKGRVIRMTKAPADGSVAKSYELAVQIANELEEEAARKAEANGEQVEAAVSTNEPDSTQTDESNKAVETDKNSDIQVVEGTSSPAKQEKTETPTPSEKKADGVDKKPDSAERKKDTKDKESNAGVGGGSTSDKKATDKSPRVDNKPNSPRARKESREAVRTHERGRLAPRNPRQFRHGGVGGREAGDFRRHAGHVQHRPIERVHRDRPPLGRGHGSRVGASGDGGRRRSPHAQLTFDQIREIRDEQRRRDAERRKREEERERTAEVERQRRLEYQNYMEFKQLEREREKLRMERERIEREKQELIKLEREHQKAERDRIEKEKDELRRAKMNIEHSHRTVAIKRPYEEDDRDRRRSVEDRKKAYTARARLETGKTEAERQIEKERFERERVALSSSTGRSRSPAREVVAIGRESRRDVWARGGREVVVRNDRTRSDERERRRNSESLKSSDRRGRETVTRTAVGSSETASRYVVDAAHSSRGSASSSKRSSERYEEARSSAREPEWVQRGSYLTSSSSLSSLPLSSSSSTARDGWPLTDRKIEAWDASRLQQRAEPWISGGVGAAAAGGTSSMRSIPPPPLYSHAATAALNLPGSGLSLGSYATDRYDGYKGPFPHLRRF